MNVNLKLYWLLLVLGCFLTYGCFNNIPKTTSCNGLPVIDLTKEYPEKDFYVGDDYIEHVLLETTNEVLVDERFLVKYVSENRIVGFNFLVVYSEDGKFLRQLNNPENFYIGLGNLFNYDAQTLLVYNRHQQRFDVEDVNHSPFFTSQYFPQKAIPYLIMSV